MFSSYSLWMVDLWWLAYLIILNSPAVIAYRAQATWYNTGLGACGANSNVMIFFPHSFCYTYFT